MKTFTIWATALCLTLTLLPVSTAHAGVSGFVTRTGNRLSLNGAPFRFSGANLYWLGLGSAHETEKIVR